MMYGPEWPVPPVTKTRMGFFRWERHVLVTAGEPHEQCDAVRKNYEIVRAAWRPGLGCAPLWTEMRGKFDPKPLQVFMRVMAIQPVKVLSRRQQNMNLGGL
jgi:hypothetical protein